MTLVLSALALAAGVSSSSWEPVWSRAEGAASAETVRERGRRVVRVTHRGEKDWALARPERVAVVPGEAWTIRGRIKTRGLKGAVQLGVVVRDGADEALDWIYGAAGTRSDHGWKTLSSRFLIPARAATIHLRVTGDGPGEVWVDDVSMERVEGAPPPAALPRLVLASPALTLALGPDGAWTVTLAGGLAWTQQADTGAALVAETAERLTPLSARLKLRDRLSGLELAVTVALDPVAPEFTVMLEADPARKLAGPIRYPLPFVSRANDLLVLPYAEGLILPVTATSPGAGFKWFEWKSGFDYAEWKTSLGFGAATDLTSGYALLNETPWDSSLDVGVVEGLLAPRMSWKPQRGVFGYARRVVVRFAPTGGHVALAKRHRELMRAKGWLRTFREKAKTRPAVAGLPGAVNLWLLDRGLPADFLEDLAARGVTRAVVSIGGGWQEPGDADGVVRKAAAAGFLPSRYDIYTDAWNPKDKPPKWLRTAGCPEDVIVDADGSLHKGWLDKSEGGPFQGYYLCARTHRKTATARIGGELTRTPYAARFIDVVTASGLMECYSPIHPASRHDDQEARADMLKLVSDEFKLVTGSEEIREWAIPFSDFSEGTMTIKPADNAGYEWGKPVEPDPDYAALTAGAANRVPLFELVFHDCHQSSWYTGDGLTKVPALWDAKELFNLLYATMPLWMPDAALWKQYRDRFLASYHTVNAVGEAVGGAEMTSHAFLTPDRLVQRTEFASGHVITANFGERDYDFGGGILPMHGFVATGPGLDGWRLRIGGRVVTRIETPSKIYLDPGSKPWDEGSLRSDGPVVAFRTPSGARVVALGRATSVRLVHPAFLPALDDSVRPTPDRTLYDLGAPPTSR